MKILIKKGKGLTNSEIKIMHDQRIKEYGKNRINFNKETKSIFFFVKDKDKIVAFGMLKPIKIDYLRKTYEIFGIANIMSIKKKKGYGRFLIQQMIDFLKNKEKTGLGFSGGEEMKFYKKAGLKTKKLFGKRFALKNYKTGEIKFEAEDDIGDGLYYEGKDKFISKMLKTKSVGYYWVPNLTEPHW